MWKRPHPVKVTESETNINRRDKTIRTLVEELASGTQELKSLLYPGDASGKSQPAK